MTENHATSAREKMRLARELSFTIWVLAMEAMSLCAAIALAYRVVLAVVKF